MTELQLYEYENPAFTVNSDWTFELYAKKGTQSGQPNRANSCAHLSFMLALVTFMVLRFSPLLKPRSPPQITLRTQDVPSSGPFVRSFLDPRTVRDCSRVPITSLLAFRWAPISQKSQLWVPRPPSLFQWWCWTFPAYGYSVDMSCRV